MVEQTKDLHKQLEAIAGTVSDIECTLGGTVLNQQGSHEVELKVRMIHLVAFIAILISGNSMLEYVSCPNFIFRTESKMRDHNQIFMYLIYLGFCIHI